MTRINNEDSIMLESVISNYYFKKLKTQEMALELFIDSDCNLKCSYCYIMKHKMELSPDTSDKNKIIKNIDDIMNFVKARVDGKFPLDIFSGEFFALPYWNRVFDVIFEHADSISHIVIPTNMTFIANDSTSSLVQSYIDKFRSVGVDIYLSASTEGYVLEDTTRKLINKGEIIRDMSYFDKLFAFCEKNSIGFHPMVSSFNIEKWIENYDWFMTMYKKYNYFGADHDFLSGPMMLEVRDDDWTNEKIEYYLKFLDHIINKRSSMIKTKNDLEIFIKSLFFKPLHFYDNISLMRIGDDAKGISCAIQTNLAVRCIDKAIIPCHRTSYEQFVAGHINDDGDIVARNVSPFISILSAKGSNLPVCNSCSIKDYCIKGCLGSQYEYSKELFVPNVTVCNLLKAKTVFLLQKYVSMGYVEIFLSMTPEDNYMKRCQEELASIIERMGI